MRCPRCSSEQIQRDFDDARALVRLAGMHKLLCNSCGHVFHGFDPFGKLDRNPTNSKREFRKRRSPRYPAHLPAAISLIQGTTNDRKVTYSEPSKGHCEAISLTGMGLALVGSRFPAEELSQTGRLLFVRIDLPAATIEAVVSIVNHRRAGENKRWLLGVKIHQISDSDKAHLQAYLNKRAQEEPVLISE